MSERDLNLSNLVDPSVLDVLRSPERFVIAQPSVSAPIGEQVGCLASIREFFQSDEQIFVLSGPAGTGKSYLIPKIQAMAVSSGLDVVVCAPTGQAAKRLRSKGMAAITLHSALYGEPEFSQEPSEERPPTYWFRLRKISHARVFIVDESSMIGDGEYTEEERSESEVLYENGNLMSDLLKNVLESGSRNRIIFLGDKNQLPPANGALSQCLDHEFLASKDLKVRHFELSTLHRTSEESKIRRLSSFLSGEGGGRLDRLPNDFLKAGEVESRPTFQDVTKEFKDEFSNGSAIAVVATNLQADTFNDLIRSAIYGEKNHHADSEVHVRTADRMVATRGCRFLGMLSGDEFTVESIYEGELEMITGPANMPAIHLQKIKASIEEYGAKYEFDTYIVNESLTKSRSNKDITRILWVDYLIRMRKANKHATVYLAAETIGADAFFNALRSTFSYARTCNKAQGGEWPVVIADATEWQASNPKWGYTAATRAKQRLIILTRFTEQKTDRTVGENVPTIRSGQAVGSGDEIVQRLVGSGFRATVEQDLEHGFQIAISTENDTNNQVHINIYFKKGKPSSYIRTRGAWDSTTEKRFALAETEIAKWIIERKKVVVDIPPHLARELERINKKALQDFNAVLSWETIGPFLIRLTLEGDGVAAVVVFSFGLKTKGLTGEQRIDRADSDLNLLAVLRTLVETKGF